MKVIKINTNSDFRAVNSTLKGIHKRYNKLSKEVLRKFGARLVSAVKDSAAQAGIEPFTGHLYGRGVRWEQKDRSGALYIPAYALRLDKSPQNVKVTRNSKTVKRWILQTSKTSYRTKELVDELDSGKKNFFFMSVRQYPFVRRGWQRARRSLPQYVRTEANRLIREIR
jgi:hypothetical protein